MDLEVNQDIYHLKEIKIILVLILPKVKVSKEKKYLIELIWFSSQNNWFRQVKNLKMF